MNYIVKYRDKQIKLTRNKDGTFNKPPLGEFTKTGLGSTWLDSCRIPYESEDVWKAKNAVIDNSIGGGEMGIMTAHSLHKGKEAERYDSSGNTQGRFPANLLVSDKVIGDEYSRYFDLDKWYDNLIKEKDVWE